MRTFYRVAAVGLVVMAFAACGGDSDRTEVVDPGGIVDPETESADSIAWQFSAPLVAGRIDSISVGDVAEERVGELHGERGACPGDPDDPESCGDDKRLDPWSVQEYNSVVVVSDQVWGTDSSECVLNATRRIEKQGDAPAVEAWDLGYERGQVVICVELASTTGFGLPVTDGRVALRSTYERHGAPVPLDHSPLAEAFEGMSVDDATSALVALAAAGNRLTDEAAIDLVSAHRSG